MEVPDGPHPTPRDPPHRRGSTPRPAASIDALIEVLEAWCDPGAADEVLGCGFGARVGELRDRLRLAELAIGALGLAAESPLAAELVALRRLARRLEEELLAQVGLLGERLDRAWEETDSAQDEADGGWLWRHIPPSACEEARALRAELANAVQRLEEHLSAAPR